MKATHKDEDVYHDFIGYRSNYPDAEVLGVNIRHVEGSIWNLTVHLNHGDSMHYRMDWPGLLPVRSLEAAVENIFIEGLRKVHESIERDVPQLGWAIQ